MPEQDSTARPRGRPVHRRAILQPLPSQESRYMRDGGKAVLGGNCTPSNPSPVFQPLVRVLGRDQEPSTPGTTLRVVYVLLLLSKDCMWLCKTTSSLQRDENEWEAAPAKHWKLILHKPPSHTGLPSHLNADPRCLSVLWSRALL